MDKVYILWGSTGEYADYRDWLVGVYSDRKKAEDKLAEINKLRVAIPDDEDKLFKELFKIKATSGGINQSTLDYYIVEYEVW